MTTQELLDGIQGMLDEQTKQILEGIKALVPDIPVDDLKKMLSDLGVET